MWRTLHDAWWRVTTTGPPQSMASSWACRVLEASAGAYAAAVRLRNAAYDRGWIRPVRLPCPVISVGNLTVGGAGKTACVELLARRLAGMGRRVALLSRGYGGPHRDYWLRQDGGHLTTGGIGGVAGGRPADEPQLLAMRLDGVPVVVGAQRARTGQWACATFAPEVLVLDDGFQHRRVHRDCEVVLVRADMPLGGLPMLPRGPMREPLSSLARADVVIITKVEAALEMVEALSERLRSINPNAAFVTAAHEPAALVEGLTGQASDLRPLEGARVVLCSSIGDPEGFETTVRRLHATVIRHERFPDHHSYRQEDWQAICARAGQGRPQALVTTEKDWVRLRPLALGSTPCPAPVWVLGIRMQLVTGADALDDRLARLCVR